MSKGSPGQPPHCPRAPCCGSRLWAGQLSSRSHVHRPPLPMGLRQPFPPSGSGSQREGTLELWLVASHGGTAPGLGQASRVFSLLWLNSRKAGGQEKSNPDEPHPDLDQGCLKP